MISNPLQFRTHLPAKKPKRHSKFARHAAVPTLLAALIMLATASVQATPSTPPNRILPVTTLIPLTASAPVSLPELRGVGNGTVPMTGNWRFALTHGQTIWGNYTPSSRLSEQFSASSAQGENPAMNAFDGSPQTRWCADSADVPQWLEVNLGKVDTVSGIDITWEKSDATYQCRIEGSGDEAEWTTLADKTAAPGIGNGPVAFGPAAEHYLRIYITKVNAQPYGWASLTECVVHIVQDGQPAIWKPDLASLGSTADDAFAGTSYDDSKWDTISVPSNWEILGYSKPTYNGVDDSVGQYRRWVNVPANYAGKKVYWRFDGVYDGADIFVNGLKAGYHESGYTAFDVDITGLVKPGQRNLFAVRACKSTSTVDLDTGDYEGLGGIYRETFLYATPQTHVSDVTVTTDFDSAYKNANLAADVQLAGEPGASLTVTGKLVDVQTGAVLPAALTGNATANAEGVADVALAAVVDAPKKWSAEKPNLYYLMLTVKRGSTIVERVEQRFGFRKIEISKDQVVLWNGVPIKTAGVCRHEIYPTLGAALNDDIWRKDIALLKGANVNAIRTSHYNHASRFLELADESGFYILDEIPFCWIGDKVNDTAYVPGLIERAQETIARDKNRPGVLAWSCGNENPLGPNLQTVLDYVHLHDPTRPAFASQMGPHDLKGQSFRDQHYPGPQDVENFATYDGKIAPVIFTEQPHIFWQDSWHAYDPGVSDLWSEVLQKSWTTMNAHPNIIGSFIWEWQDQPVADKFTDDGHDANGFRYQNNKGIVTGYRVPKPEWWSVKMVYSPIRFETKSIQPENGQCTVAIDNRYSFTDLSETICQWTALEGSRVLGSGTTTVSCAPLTSVNAPFPVASGTTCLRIEFLHPNGDLITGANLNVDGAPTPQPHAVTQGSPLQIGGDDNTLRVSNDTATVEFNKQTGQLSRVQSLGKDIITGCALNLGETLGKQDDWFMGGKTNLYGPGQLSLTGGQCTATTTGATVHVMSSATVNFGPNNAPVGTLATTYYVSPNGRVDFHWMLTWTASDAHLWELGEKLSIPVALSHMSWLRDSQLAMYQPGQLGAPTGDCTAADLEFRASKRNLHWMQLTDDSGAGFALISSDSPLIGRGAIDGNANSLYASLQEAGPRDFSGAWVAEHDINLQQGKTVSGSFILEPVRQ